VTVEIAADKERGKRRVKYGKGKERKEGRGL
jgi:hypothetical protein